MSLFVISDLHLSLAADKSMIIFKGWEGYVERIENNWKRLVKEDDTVVIPGDISWALKIEETFNDFSFLNALPGKKILIKGNHDLWWGTKSKVDAYLKENGFDRIEILYNNYIEAEGVAVCGTRGWFYEEPENNKIRLREAARLRRSLESAAKDGLPIKTFLHYPPVYGDYVCDDILDVLKEFKIDMVYYGHIHGSGCNNSVKEYDGIKLKLISADCINFTPVPVRI